MLFVWSRSPGLSVVGRDPPLGQGTPHLAPNSPGWGAPRHPILIKEPITQIRPGTGPPSCTPLGAAGPGGTHPGAAVCGPFTTEKRPRSSLSPQYRSQNFSETAPQKVGYVRSFRPWIYSPGVRKGQPVAGTEPGAFCQGPCCPSPRLMHSGWSGPGVLALSASLLGLPGVWVLPQAAYP